jgi:hypothetical protein
MIRLIQRGLASIRARTATARRRWSNRIPELVGRPEAYEFKQKFQMAFLLGHGLEPHHSLLDYGCGVLRGGIPLIKYLDAGNYAGLDVGADAIRAARKEVRRERLTQKKPTLVLVKDIESLDLGRRFDYAWCFSVFFHMTDDNVDACLRFVSRHLAKNGTFFANVGLGQHPPGSWRHFPVIWRTLDDYSARARAAGLNVSPLGALSQFGHHSPTDPEEDTQVMLAFTVSPRV